MTSRKKGVARYNIAEAKARFSELVQAAMLGQDVIIARGNKPLVRLVPLAPRKAPRQPGSARGRIRMAPDFDTTPEDFGDLG